MTDWLPWGLALMVGTFTTLGLLMRALARTPVGERPDVRAARWTFGATVLVTLALYSMYLLFGERWIWYF